MPLDYLNEASDEVQRLFARLDDVERMLRMASEERRPMIGEERYLTGEVVCTRRTSHRAPCRRCGTGGRSPLRYLATACCSIPNREYGRCLTATCGRLPSNRLYEFSDQMIRGLFSCIPLPPDLLCNYRQENAIAPHGETKRRRVPLSSQRHKNHRP